MKFLVTGGAGLVGSECCRLFSENGHEVVSIDNYMRGKIFGREGSTRDTMKGLLKDHNIINHEIDISDKRIIKLVKDTEVVIHTAAQPSHPKSIEIPMDDFQINAYGTLFLLEALRKYNKDAVFIFCSTNKLL